MWAFPAGLIGGRIYFLITTPSQVPDHWWGPFAIWQGGLGIWGGIAAGAAVGLCVRIGGCRAADLRRFMDVVAPGLLVAQAIGRIGNYFNQELFGKPTTLPWGLEISPRAPAAGLRAVRHLPADVPVRDHLEPVPGRRSWSGSARRRRVRPPGVFALYVAGYSGFRIFEETLRIDYSNHILGLRLNFFVALVLCLLGLAWFVAIQRGWRGFGGPKGEPAPAPSAAAAAAQAGGDAATAAAAPRQARPDAAADQAACARARGRSARPRSTGRVLTTASAAATPGARWPPRSARPRSRRSGGRRS